MKTLPSPSKNPASHCGVSLAVASRSSSFSNMMSPLSWNLLERVGDYEIHTSRRSRLVSRVELHDSSDKICDVRLVNVPMIVSVFCKVVGNPYIGRERRLRRTYLSLEDGVRRSDFKPNTTISKERPCDI